MYPCTIVCIYAYACRHALDQGSRAKICHVGRAFILLVSTFSKKFPSVQGDRTKAKPSLVFPTATVVKVKDAKTTRKQIKCSAYDNTKKSPFVFV